MDFDFYRYTTLNIDCDDYLFGNRFNIRLGLGAGLTSMIYWLEKNEDNMSCDPTSLVLKISKRDRFFRIFEK